MAGVRQFDEAAVLEKSLCLFWERGYKATSMIELAKVTGVQRGSLYNAYSNKATLFIKAFTHYREQLLKQLESSLDSPSIKQALTNCLEHFCKRLCHETQGNGCLSTRAIMEACSEDSFIQKHLKQLLDDIENVFIQRLKQARNSSDFAGNPEDIARYLVTFTRGLAVVERTYQNIEYLQKVCCTAIELLPIDENCA